MRAVTGKTYYDAFARDTVAMVVNDVIVVGAEPQVVTAYWAVGASGWFDDRARAGRSRPRLDGRVRRVRRRVGRGQDSGAGRRRRTRDDRSRRRAASTPTA
jgi:hypothetical protein